MKKKSMFLNFIFIASLLAFTSCANDDEKEAAYFYVSYVSRIGEAPSPVKIEEGSYLSTKELPVLVYDNYTFNGWFIDDEKIQPDSYKVNDNIILTASWTGQTCAVTFTHSDNIGGQRYVKVYENGQTITLPESPYGTKTGLEFKGWLCNSTYYQAGSSYTVTSDAIFTAFYAENGTHTISYFNVCDGSLVTDDSKFADAESLTGTDNPTSFTESQNVFISKIKKTGYTFHGWYLNSSCETEADTYWTASTVKSDLNLYAKWTVNNYTIYFDGNGGSLIDSNDEQESVTKSYEDKITLPECKFELAGYEFVGWSIDSEEFNTEFDANTQIEVKELCSNQTSSGSITLYAHWLDSTAPASPENFKVKEISSNSITLEWTVASDSDLAYTRLSYYEKNDTDKEFQDFPAEEYVLGSAQNYTVSNLTQGATYYFTITSYDIAGNANEYNAANTLLAVPRPAAYEPELSFSQPSPRELLVLWDAPDFEEHPYIEKITLYVDGAEANSYTGENCYDSNSFTTSVNPLTSYTVQLKLIEKTDDAGRNNPSESDEYSYFTEPDYNVTVNTKELYGEYYTFWRYSNSLGFSLGELVDKDGNTPTAPITYQIYAETTPLDESGQEISRYTTREELQYNSNLGLYIRNKLEPDTSYNVKILIKVSDDNGNYSFSNLLANEIQNCKTASSNPAELGYFCYNANTFYADIQPYDSSIGEPIGIVTEVTNSKNFTEAKTVMAISDRTGITSPEAAKNEVASLTQGYLTWHVPSTSEIEAVFDNYSMKESIEESINRLENASFTSSTIDDSGKHTGRYIAVDSSEYYAYDIDGTLRSEKETTAEGEIFSLRAFATLTEQE